MEGVQLPPLEGLGPEYFKAVYIFEPYSLPVGTLVAAVWVSCMSSNKTVCARSKKKIVLLYGRWDMSIFYHTNEKIGIM